MSRTFEGTAQRIDAVALLALSTGLSCAASGDLSRSSTPHLALPPPAASAPAAPGPAPRLRTFDAAALNASCEECHSEIAAEWRSSLHRQAHSHPVYQAQLAKEPAAFCNACHAPEAPPSEAVPEATGTLGVGCVTCHVVGDQIWASPEKQGSNQAHPVWRTSDLAASKGCAGCHEFAFPDPRPNSPPLLMQSTITEHAASAFADRTCASCHMPDAPGGPAGRHKDHTFSASRDEALVRSAIVIEEPQIEEDTLTLVLRPGRVGHAFPTGDMLRRIALTIDVLGPDGTLLQQKTQYLARHFRLSSAPGSPLGRSVSKDDRLSSQTAPLVLRHTLIRPPSGGRVHYALRYERVADPGSDRESPRIPRRS